ncbi:hypothetical protein [Azotobacter salinestris]|uniref:hypothetical protein n=1 Tax=Azotobacter salinestris TaxID=69964 RepID=UPI001266BF9E|nr:hypothetical protein [Azotobacter salinestris]
MTLPRVSLGPPPAGKKPIGAQYRAARHGERAGKGQAARHAGVIACQPERQIRINAGLEAQYLVLCRLDGFAGEGSAQAGQHVQQGGDGAQQYVVVVFGGGDVIPTGLLFCTFVDGEVADIRFEDGAHDQAPAR